MLFHADGFTQCLLQTSSLSHEMFSRDLAEYPPAMAENGQIGGPEDPDILFPMEDGCQGGDDSLYA